MTQTAIYKATLDTPVGLFLIAVSSTQLDARSDIYSAAYAEINAPSGMLRVKGAIQKSNRRILQNMHCIKQAQSNGQQWAWIAKKET